jgi:hypothetical protein
MFFFKVLLSLYLHLWIFLVCTNSFGLLLPISDGSLILRLSLKLKNQAVKIQNQKIKKLSKILI